jgi:hypothetical protein
MRRIAQDRRTTIIGLSMLLALSCASQDGAGPSRTAEESAAELARLSVELGSLDDALDRAADWAWGATVDAITLELGREPTEEERTRGRDILRGVIAEFVTPELWKESVARVYAEHFTAGELNEMIRFYDSPVGRKVLSLESELTDEVDGLFEEALDGETLQAFIARVDEALGAELGLGEGDGS